MALWVMALCAFPSMSAGEPLAFNRSVLRFDAGPRASSVEAGGTGLNLESIYTPEAGFGWTQPPQSGFNRRELSRSRNALTIDGVSGRRLGFRADVAPGVWNLTLWLEPRRKEASPPKFILQGEEREPRWHAFRAEEEPNEPPQKTFRVFHAAAAVGATGFTFELQGDQEDIRLLGFSLIRQASAMDPKHRKLLLHLESAGRYGGDESLDGVLNQAEGLLRQNPEDAFAAFWLERIELLARAERLSSMRGWEWADRETGLGMFDRLNQSIMLLDGLLSAAGAEAMPLTERALFLRGRLLYWLGKQHGGASEIAGGRRDLEKLYEQHPDDEMLAMYNGVKVDLPDACDCLTKTSEEPAWSTAQREALCRLRQISHWWVDEQQSLNGEFGGKLGDDVELLRWWAPLVLSGDDTARRGWQKLADGVWQSDRIHDGYSRELRDVEHAAEFIADTAPLMVLCSDDPRYEHRLAHSARHFDALWTGVTANGHRFFRSAWFSSTAVATDEPKGRDLEYNTRAVRAIRYLAWRRRDPEHVKLLHEWSTAWVSAALRTDKGKPKGIIPASVRFADEALNGDGPNWYRANMHWDYYEWEFYAGSLMLDQLLFTYTLTGDEQLLQPMFLALELVQAEESRLARDNQAALQEGSRAWTADKLIRSSFFWSVVEQWRFRANDSRWDELILRHGTPYGRYRISEDERHLVGGLDQILSSVRYNTPLRTTEAIHTDRVYVPGWEHLKAMLTGDGMQENSSPYYAASWEKTDDAFTALVSNAAPDRLEVQLYSHAPDERSIVMRLWQLRPGKYRLHCEPEGRSAAERTISVDGQGQRIEVKLPSRRLLRISVSWIAAS